MGFPRLSTGDTPEPRKATSNESRHFAGSPDTSPALRCYMNWLALDGLPEFSSGRLPAIRDAGEHRQKVAMNRHPALRVDGAVSPAIGRQKV